MIVPSSQCSWSLADRLRDYSHGLILGGVSPPLGARYLLFDDGTDGRAV